MIREQRGCFQATQLFLLRCLLRVTSRRGIRTTIGIVIALFLVSIRLQPNQLKINDDGLPETIGFYHKRRYIAPVWSNSRSDMSKTFGEKYCAYQRPHLWFKKLWHCFRCRPNSTKTCRDASRLRPNGKCPPFRGLMNDTVSWYDGEIGSIPTKSLRYLHYHVYRQQPACTVKTCWDFTRCQSLLVENSTLTIYANGTDDEILLTGARRTLTGTSIRLVSDPKEACLVLITKDTYSSARELYNTQHWRDSVGQNHLLWQSNRFGYRQVHSKPQRLTADSPFSTFSTGYALLASSSLTAATVRSGYDLVLPLIRFSPRHWRRNVPPDQVDIHRPRRWILSFRGTIQNSIHAGQQQRWLAAEYWTPEPDVMVDVQCQYSRGGRRRTIKSYDFPSAIYNEILWNSTFGYCPSGSGISSYRLAEIMSTGGIPVVVGPQVIPPFELYEEFRACWIFVDVRDIPDLPRRLRLISQSEIRRRQQTCWQLYRSIWGDTQVRYGGWSDDETILLASALKNLIQRIDRNRHLAS